METIPDEIYEIICAQLSARDLRNALLIDRYSRFIIENSPVLMEKLPIFITDEEVDDFIDIENGRLIEPLLDSRRKVTKVVVDLKRDKIMSYLAIFKKFGDTIRILEIRNYAFDTIDQLRIILRYLRNLEQLKVTKVSFLKPENKILNSIVQIPKLSICRLRELECVNSDPKIFSLFTNNRDCQLRAIRLRANDVHSFRYGDFIEFMTQQTRLKHLTIEGMTSDNSDIFDCHDFLKCRVETLILRNCVLSFRDHMRNLIQLIKSQRSLKVMKILNSPIPRSIDVMSTYRQILSGHIREAHLDIGDLSFVHSQHFTNRSVRDLTICGNFAFENLPIFINFIKIFPNVVRLKLKGSAPINDKYLFNILSTFRNLEELKVPGFTSRSADSNFAILSSLSTETKLTTLELDYIDYDVKFFGWKNIVSNLRLIDKLIIKRDYGKVSNEILDVIVKKLKLRHLELGLGVVSAEILRHIVYNNCCEQLKVLKIAKSDFEKIEDRFDFGKMFVRNQLLLHLCDDDYFRS